MEENLTRKQKLIALAQSEHADAIIELIRDCTVKQPLIAESEFKTLVNAVTLESEANLMMRVADYIVRIKQGELHKNV